tara:strand:- start:2839 stop:3258 length:420 start_codon:yes stop_codon:yes gene_type:complete
MVKPNSTIKIDGRLYPVFRSPVTEDMIQECLVSGKSNIFFIHDMKSGKMKKYDFTGKMPTRQTIDFNMSYSSILKVGFGVVVATYVYKVLTFKPFSDFKRKNAEWLKELEKKKKAKKQSPVDTSGVMPNGWVIEEEANA